MNRELNIKELYIEELNGKLSTRAYNLLNRIMMYLEIANVYDLDGIYKDTLMKYRNLGEVSLEEIITVLGEYGIIIANDMNQLRFKLKSELSTKAWNILERLSNIDINNLQELNGKSIEVISGQRNAGKKTVQELVEVLGKHGIYFTN